MASSSWPKAKVGAAVAVAAVLVGGSAMAVASTGRRGTPAPAAAEVTTTVATTPPTTAPAATVPLTTTASATQVVFRVGEAGAVTLGWGDGALHVVATAPATGWAADPAVSPDPAHVSVDLRSSTLVVHLRAELTPAGVVPSVTSELLPTAAPAGTGTGAEQPGGPAAAPAAADPTAPPAPAAEPGEDDDAGEHADEEHDDEGEHHEEHADEHEGGEHEQGDD